jgi:hypothetical protein
MSEQPRLLDGDLAVVRYTHGGGVQLAQYRDPEGDGVRAYWAYFGSDWTDSPSEITVVRRVQLTEVSS